LEFVSKLEETLPAEELLFEPTLGFGPYKPFLEHAIAHPAKANTLLLRFLIENFTREGEVVLDPMAGSGSTGVVAALLGRNAIQVELEKKFFDWMEKAREKVEKHITLTPKGWIKNICGDSRHLSKLLSKVDIVLTSPPYADAKKGGEADEEAMAERWDRAFKEKGEKWNSWGKTSKTPGRKRSFKALGSGYSTSKENIGNLPLGSIDCCLTSPPYAGTGESRKEFWERLAKDPSSKRYGRKKHPTTCEHYGESEENIGNLLNKSIDAIITSPPYTNSAAENPNVTELQKKGWVKGGDLNKFLPQNLSSENIGNLPLGNVDTIITSPPYEGSLEGTSRHTKGGIASRDPALAQADTHATVLSKATKQGVPVGYSPNKDNIGNLKSKDEEYEALVKGFMSRNGKPTYLSEMFKVYANCYKVLKPGGRAIIIVKPFIRNKKVIDLPYHTWLLMAKAGFRLEKLYKLRLKNQSFWRILMYKKHPELPKIAHEWILVCRKPFNHGGGRNGASA
jgi:DNA modification methylase